MNRILWHIREWSHSFLPGPIRRALASGYHFSVAMAGAAAYGFPSRRMLVVGVTGTKGKSSTTEMVNAILERDGYKTVLLNSIRIKVADHSEANIMRMSMPGRFFIEKLLDQGLKAGCTAAVIEMTSEGARQHRHRGIDLDALVFTNLAPEHIESHGSFEAYADAKYELGKHLVRSRKRPRFMVANADDAQSPRYLTLPVEHTLPFSLSAHAPYHADENGGSCAFGDATITLRAPGLFSLENALAAATLCAALGISTETIVHALEAMRDIPGRAERIDAGQSYTVVVDYAHTPDSLKALYSAYANIRTVCVLGSTGGGRDTWKRPVMGSVADEMCDEVILTNEDPYDEDPRSIVEALARGMRRTPTVIMDRREAIAHALSIAHPGDAVLITGKGTDPNIAIERGKKIPWSDARVAREEIGKSLKKDAILETP